MQQQQKNKNKNTINIACIREYYVQEHTVAERYYSAAPCYLYYCLDCTSYSCLMSCDAPSVARCRLWARSTWYFVEMLANIYSIHAIHCPPRIDWLDSRCSFRHRSDTETPACNNSIIIKTIKYCVNANYIVCAYICIYMFKICNIQCMKFSVNMRTPLPTSMWWYFRIIHVSWRVFCIKKTFEKKYCFCMCANDYLQFLVFPVFPNTTSVSHHRPLHGIVVVHLRQITLHYLQVLPHTAEWPTFPEMCKNSCIPRGNQEE